MAEIGGVGGKNPFQFGLQNIVQDEREKALKEVAQLQKGGGPVTTDKTTESDATTSIARLGEIEDVLLVNTNTQLQQQHDTSSTAKPGDGHAPLAIEGVGSSKGSTSPDLSQQMLHDVSSAYGHMEQSVELMYNRLIQSEKNNKAELEDQIKNIDKQIASLKDEQKKLDIIVAKVNELMPKFMEMVGSDAENRACCGPSPDTLAQQANFTEFLGEQLKAVGIELDPAKVAELAQGMFAGGQAGMALAVMMVFAIAEASADIAINGSKDTQPKVGDQPSDPSATDPPLAASNDPSKNLTTNTDTSSLPVQATPEAIKADFGPATLQAKLDHLAEFAGQYANASKHTYDDLFFPHRVETSRSGEASNKLMDALCPGGHVALTGPVADAKKSGVDIGGFTMSAEQFAVMGNLRDSSHGMGPGLATSFAMGIFQAQYQAKTQAISKQIEALRTEIKTLQKEIKDIDKEIDKLEKEKSKAIDDIKKQKGKAVAELIKMIEQNTNKEEKIKSIFADCLVLALDSISETIGALAPHANKAMAFAGNR